MRRSVTVTVLGLVLIAGCSNSEANNAARDADMASQSSAYWATVDADDPSTEATTATERVETASYPGSGDDVVSIGMVDKLAVLTFSCPQCDGNTVLKTDGAEGLLVNTIGSYAGTHFINLRDNSLTSQLEVNASGTWTVKIEDPFTGAESTTTSASNTGDRAIFLNGPGTKAKITNRGEGNFAVWSYSAAGSDLAVNEIGSYSGTVLITLPAFIQVTSEGSWSIDVS